MIVLLSESLPTMNTSWSLLALQGMVVAAPDYAGFGISSLPSGQPIRHLWVAGPVQANDLANAINRCTNCVHNDLYPNGPLLPWVTPGVEGLLGHLQSD